MQRFDAQVQAYCLMGNHDHFVLHTHRANLSRLMRQLNGVVTQASSLSHRKVGHLFQGHFRAVQVERDASLLEVCRDVEPNPVRGHGERARGRSCGRTACFSGSSWATMPS